MSRSAMRFFRNILPSLKDGFNEFQKKAFPYIQKKAIPYIGDFMVDVADALKKKGVNEKVVNWGLNYGLDALANHSKALRERKQKLLSPSNYISPAQYLPKSQYGPSAAYGDTSKNGFLTPYSPVFTKPTLAVGTYPTSPYPGGVPPDVAQNQAITRQRQKVETRLQAHKKKKEDEAIKNQRRKVAERLATANKAKKQKINDLNYKIEVV